jgi:hypothetical protein
MMATQGTDDAGVATDDAGNNAWNPGIQSQVPPDLQHLCTIFRPENAFGSLADAQEAHTLTGIALCELVAFRPRRLALHETLIRVTADFAVPDGSRVEDLGIKFREITTLILERYLEPEMDAVSAVYQRVRRDLHAAIYSALSRYAFEAQSPVARTAEAPPGLLRRLRHRRRDWAPASDANMGWGVREIAECESAARAANDEFLRVAYRALARVMSALFITNGRAWGAQEHIASLAADIACNDIGSAEIGRAIEPILRRAANSEGWGILPPQERPVVINTKGPSASGKSTLRPLQKKLAREIGMEWADFALISPDIWRKQLLDYGSLGAAYKYAASFTGEELQIVDHKLDRYMEAKHRRGEMSHLLIDRFRFDSFAGDSHEAGSNFLTRFGHVVHLFFLLTAPESLVERAWKRGLDVGRFKAVDDTLAHAVEAYSGMPDVFFTWIRRRDKRIRFEFLDNSVRLGERPRSAAFGESDICHVLDVTCMLNIERYCRINVWATNAELLYADRGMLAPEHNLGVLARCLNEFRRVDFADQNSGLVYLRFEAGQPILMDSDALHRAVANPDTRAWVRAAAPGALEGRVANVNRPLYLHEELAASTPTLGSWGPSSTR